jgi:hypothetical protein
MRQKAEQKTEREQTRKHVSFAEEPDLETAEFRGTRTLVTPAPVLACRDRKSGSLPEYPRPSSAPPCTPNSPAGLSQVASDEPAEDDNEPEIEEELPPVDLEVFRCAEPASQRGRVR